MNLSRKDTKYSSTYIIDNYLCFKCQEDLNKSKNSNNTIENSNDFEFEFIKLSCKNCTINFCFVLCVFCQNKIYMKIHPKDLEYNGINGFNVKCPYKLCDKFFYFTKCIKCKRTQKQKNYIKEGEIITCIYEDCKCQYIQMNCPVKNCPDSFSIEKPKFHSNFPFGMISIHKKEIEVIYQKINCYYCFQPIVFFSKKDKKNKYLECQKVVCPYKNCKKSFNRIICPFCNDEIYINDGWYEMGSKIKCKTCKQYFGKILCPSCIKLNICKDSYFKLGKMKCGFKNCLKENYIINCIFCRKMNFFDKIPINGQIIKCGYCKNNFNEIICPFCGLLNPFPLADFTFGKVYKCKYLTCLKEFQFLICPFCLTYSFTKETHEGQKYKCNQCQLLFINWGCPFCKSNIMCKNTSLKIGQMVKCPSKNCGKIYSFIRCSKCERLIFSKENENIFGNSKKCPYIGCESYTMISECTLCNTKSIYSGLTSNYVEKEKISCPSCKGIYKFKKNNEICTNGLDILNQIEGNTLNFGEGEIDENYLLKKDLFFNNNQYSSQSIYDSLNDKTSKTKIENKGLDGCIVCHNNLKESIFYPCGHRCVCYNCAVIIFAVNKKCPKCNQKAECIIRKIYE